VIHNGPIPYFVHGVIDYLAGALLIVAPFLFGFTDRGAATAVSIVLGVLVLIFAASTDGPTSLVNSIPVPVHILFDLGVGVLAIASPFLFGFSGDGTATPFFIAFGVLDLLIVIGTRFPREKRAVQA
jgi:SPW repeat-containing protein